MGKLHGCTRMSSSGFVQLLGALAAKPTTESIKLNRVAVRFAVSLLPEPAAVSCFRRVCLNSIWKQGSVISQKGKCSFNRYCTSQFTGIHSFSKSHAKLRVCIYAARQRGLLLITGCFSTTFDLEGYPRVSLLSEETYQSSVLITF